VRKPRDSVMIIVCNLVADILYGALAPRIRYT
jgi:ABC-type dipeptide/oligopeptide/nickel transport system permease component